jgi:hypothetical protein
MGKFGDKVTEVADWASSDALADNTVASARKVTTLTIRIQPSGSKDLNALAKLALERSAHLVPRSIRKSHTKDLQNWALVSSVAGNFPLGPVV